MMNPLAIYAVYAVNDHLAALRAEAAENRLGRLTRPTKTTGLMASFVTAARSFFGARSPRSWSQA